MEEEKKNQNKNPDQKKESPSTLDLEDRDNGDERSFLQKTPKSPFLPKSDDGNISDDIKKILKKTKLPERREFGKQKNVPKTFDTKIGPDKNEGSSEILENVQKDPRPDNAEPKIKSLRTFKDDLQGLVKIKKMSLVKAATLETEKVRGQTSVSTHDNAAKSKTRARVFAIVFAIVVLVGLGTLALFVVLAIQNQRLGDAPIVQDNSLLFSEQTFTLPITDQEPRDLLEQMAQARSGVGLTLGAITRIVPTIFETDPDSGQLFEKEATTAEFFSALGTRVPQDFLRSFDTFFFLGIHTIDENVPVIIIPVVLYQNAFSDMLEWERNINEDLSPLFTKIPYQNRGLDGNITINSFEDVIIRNYDVRVLRDSSGNIKMLYAFPTKEILIIAESPHSFVEALARLRAGRRL
ncbi:hypothetical protein COU13_01165 [Candidatus Kaiserbacteria bacterium CG10_big_fil_rev_8_21_14_0_10_43_70]|uniref:Uncharacterized protein n=1 Tax=Candidatus Kaiserbacteria bacterium CG10_big_fil_rev_8_21_14_0_10_43_70 TaxID=1974605 RepID=A0A2H0UKU6_9BACT|nr:MAG: hypothetical protein COU13_01165 [Candidatus Kaiserbacteria bacterium CG10_big_fil_rev_8_21_14_0_10_43_70]